MIKVLYKLKSKCLIQEFCTRYFYIHIHHKNNKLNNYSFYRFIDKMEKKDVIVKEKKLKK